MKNEGLVIDIVSSKAKIRFVKESACGGNCADCSGCSSKPIEVFVENTLDAKIGDIVLVESDTKTILKSAFILYIVPLLTLIFLYAVSNKFLNENKAVMIGVIGFFLSFAGVKSYGNKFKNNVKMLAVKDK